eukprot:PhF_6_TR8026/c0_g1_i1/m.12439
MSKQHSFGAHDKHRFSSENPTEEFNLIILQYRAEITRLQSVTEMLEFSNTMQRNLLVNDIQRFIACNERKVEVDGGGSSSRVVSCISVQLLMGCIESLKVAMEDRDKEQHKRIQKKRHDNDDTTTVVVKKRFRDDDDDDTTVASSHDTRRFYF